MVTKFEPVARARASGEIFDQLAAAILKGELEDGSPLPPERVLAERFDVSRGTVRQAIHRLADAGLVRVRQGGATTVIGTGVSTDLRVMELRYKAGPQNPREQREMFERRMLEGFALVLLASVRAGTDELAAIAKIAEDYAARGAPDAELGEVEREIWGGLSKLTGNRLYESQIAWWFRMAQDGASSSPGSMPAATRAAFYRELFRRLVAKDGAPRYYLDILTMIVSSVAPGAEG